MTCPFCGEFDGADLPEVVAHVRDVHPEEEKAAVSTSALRRRIVMKQSAAVPETLASFWPQHVVVHGSDAVSARAWSVECRNCGEVEDVKAHLVRGHFPPEWHVTEVEADMLAASERWVEFADEHRNCVHKEKP